jgi:hypothetical protein
VGGSSDPPFIVIGAPVRGKGIDGSGVEEVERERNAPATVGGTPTPLSADDALVAKGFAGGRFAEDFGGESFDPGAALP